MGNQKLLKTLKAMVSTWLLILLARALMWEIWFVICMINTSDLSVLWLILHYSCILHFRGYQDFAIEPHYEKLGEVNMQSEIARRQKLKQGNFFRHLVIHWSLSVHFVWKQQNSQENIWIICWLKNGIKIKDLMIWWMVSVKKERNHSERERDFGQ